MPRRDVRTARRRAHHHAVARASARRRMRGEDSASLRVPSHRRAGATGVTFDPVFEGSKQAQPHAATLEDEDTHG